MHRYYAKLGVALHGLELVPVKISADKNRAVVVAIMNKLDELKTDPALASLATVAHLRVSNARERVIQGCSSLLSACIPFLECMKVDDSRSVYARGTERLMIEVRRYTVGEEIYRVLYYCTLVYT
jgi:hypothetical protein